jgi:hypothetical protein
MLHKLILMVLIVGLLMLSPSQVDAYGAAHVGYTHVGPYGVQHYGATAHYGPYSSGYSSHVSGYGAYGAYGGGYHAGSTYQYSGGAAYGGAYHYGYIR